MNNNSAEENVVAWHVYDPKRDLTFVTQSKREADEAGDRGCRIVPLVPLVDVRVGA
ncbi:hypothetical protein BGLT_02284 [Caballeronia glathei]|uniref:hypothetical protein n=1 Tax=Caballeronia glathei TaxID=60547 RepID=UPI0005067FFB|nr:hypothetical protein [Caballeronia glathei]CDY79503.1 hypothetical protein BGLT_02284 [Caballeronia glathei]